MICRAREEGKNSGILKGEREGKRESKLEGKREIVLTLLESMDIKEVSKITKLSIKEIEDLIGAN